MFKSRVLQAPAVNVPPAVFDAFSSLTWSNCPPKSVADQAPSPVLVNAVALLAFGCLGLSSFDKFTAMKKDVAIGTKDEE